MTRTTTICKLRYNSPSFVTTEQLINVLNFHASVLRNVPSRTCKYLQFIDYPTEYVTKTKLAKLQHIHPINKSKVSSFARLAQFSLNVWQNKKLQYSNDMILSSLGQGQSCNQNVIPPGPFSQRSPIPIHKLSTHPYPLSSLVLVMFYDAQVMLVILRNVTNQTTPLLIV